MGVRGGGTGVRGGGANGRSGGTGVRGGGASGRTAYLGATYPTIIAITARRQNNLSTLISFHTGWSENEP